MSGVKQPSPRRLGGGRTIEKRTAPPPVSPNQKPFLREVPQVLPAAQPSPDPVQTPTPVRHTELHVSVASDVYADQKSDGDHVPVSWIATGIVFGLLVAFAAYYFVAVRPVSTFVPSWESITVRRDFPERAVTPEWLTDIREKGIKQGKGLNLVVIKNIDGKETPTTEELIPPVA